jgi:hypothetical protein
LVKLGDSRSIALVNDTDNNHGMAATLKKRALAGPKKSKSSRAKRLAAINEVCGKYAHVSGGSEAFARQKQKEIDRENRVR